MKTTFPVTAQTPANHHAMLIWNRAFTILELLAVVSIIGLLAAMVLPALSRAQAKAHGVSCLNNLKQLQMGWQMYVDDHGGKVPENYADLSTGVWRSSSNSWAGPSSAPFDPDDSAIRQGSIFRLGLFKQPAPSFAREMMPQCRVAMANRPACPGAGATR